jgi:flagellar hook-associated protein FlgK
MAVIGTFGSFTAARLGIYASQSSLNVTGNNIANINTKGYTRQRMDLVSLHSDGNIRYANSYNLNIGYGVLAEGVSQLRDPFLDIRFRDENAKVGSYQAKLDCLDQMASILDEVGKGTGEFGIIEAQFNDLLAQLENFNGNAGVDVYDTTVRGSAESLTKLFRDYAEGLKTVENNKLNQLKEDVKTVNSLLTRIRDLSEQIREAGIHGDKALELRDDRNVYIDELSAYMKIDVSYDMEKIDEFSSVERINISIAGSGNPPIKLIQGIYGTQLTMPDTTAKRNPAYDPSKPQSNRYISQESTPGNIKYTNVEREALRNENGDIITNDNAGEALIKQMAGFENGISDANKYNPDNARYLDKDGNPTDDPELAAQVDNAVEGSEENRLWMSLEPLKDARGKFMKDQYHKDITESVDLTDNQLYGSLQAIREFLTEKGEFSSADDRLFDPEATQKRGVQYYKKSLDALAKKFADELNKANRLDFGQVSEAYKQNANGEFIDKDGNVIRDKDGNAITAAEFDDLADDIAELDSLREELKKVLADKTLDETAKETERQRIQTAIDALEQTDIPGRSEALYEKMELLRQSGDLTTEWAFYNGGVLFSNHGDTNDPTGINASNITISSAWSTGDVRILNTKKPDTLIEDPNGGPDKVLSHTTADDNIYHIINLINKDFDYLPSEIVDNAADGTKKYFTGSFQERLSDMNSILALDGQTTATLYNNTTTQALVLENSRQSVSGVDLNDEATNMMVFQKSYAAACQLMTTLDSMLDKLINGTIR